MPGFDVPLEFESDDHRKQVVKRLRDLGELPDGELIEDDDGVRLHLDEAHSRDAALVRAGTLVRAALDGSDLNPDDVRLGGESWPASDR